MPCSIVLAGILNKLEVVQFVIENIEIFEHLAVKSNLGLKDFFDKLCEEVELYDIEYDFENETEWYKAYDIDNIEINVSRPYQIETLHEWDETVPVGCNFGISLLSSKDLFEYDEMKYNKNYVLNYLIPKYKNAIKKTSNSDVYYHRGKFLKVDKE